MTAPSAPTSTGSVFDALRIRLGLEVRQPRPGDPFPWGTEKVRPRRDALEAGLAATRLKMQAEVRDFRRRMRALALDRERYAINLAELDAFVADRPSRHAGRHGTDMPQTMASKRRRPNSTRDTTRRDFSKPAGETSDEAETASAEKTIESPLSLVNVDPGKQIESTAEETRTTVERRSDRELVVTHPVQGPIHLVYEAWAKPELFWCWCPPKSFGGTVITFDADVRTGGTYHMIMAHPSSEEPLKFCGRYIEVTPDARLIWITEDGGEDGTLTTVTFEDRDGATLVVVREKHPTKEALDGALALGSASEWSEQLEQLDHLIVSRNGKI